MYRGNTACGASDFLYMISLWVGLLDFYGSDDDFCVHDGSENGATAGVRVSGILDFLSIGILGFMGRDTYVISGAS